MEVQERAVSSKGIYQSGRIPFKGQGLRSELLIQK